MKRNENSLRDNIKCTNIHIIEGPGGEERDTGLENIFEEIIAENTSNMGKEIVNQVQEAQRVPGRNTLKHKIIKLTKIKDKDKY